MSAPRAGLALVAVLLLVGVAGACIPSASCTLVIFPTDDPSLLEVPEDVAPIISPEDLDPAGWAVLPDDGTGNGDAVSFRLRPAAAERFAAFTRAEVGGFMAVAIDGRVVSVPEIAAPIEGGDVILTGAGGDGFVEQFRPCLPAELLPDA